MARRSFLAILALAFAGGLAFGSGQASANHVSCGDEITADTTLDSDLVNCENNGVVIGADDITLDLNGHRIDGDGTPAAGCDPETEFCDVGVLNDGHDGVTVRDGWVREFGSGVFVGGARENRVLDISASSHAFFGAVVSGSSRSGIRGGSFNHNIAPEGDGIGVFGSDHIRIVNNKIRRNPGPGIHVFGSTENLIKRNRFSRNDILLEGDRNRVTGNRSVRADLGINVFGNRNVIAQNRIFRAVGGILIDNARGNLVAGNIIVRARRDGIPLFRGDNNTIRRNRVRGSGDDGIWVSQEHDRVLLSRNVAVDAGDDGFEVDSGSTKLTKNRAVRNRDLGIWAVQGVVDGGGNRASGNGDPRQCVNVTCH